MISEEKIKLLEETVLGDIKIDGCIIKGFIDEKCKTLTLKNCNILDVEIPYAETLICDKTTKFRSQKFISNTIEKIEIYESHQGARHDYTRHHEVQLSCPKLKDFSINTDFGVLTIVLDGIEANEINIFAPNCTKLKIVHENCKTIVNLPSSRKILKFENSSVITKKNAAGGYDLYCEKIDNLFISDEWLNSLGKFIRGIYITDCKNICIAHCLQCINKKCEVGVDFILACDSFVVSGADSLLLYASMGRCKEFSVNTEVIYLNNNPFQNCALNSLSIKGSSICFVDYFLDNLGSISCLLISSNSIRNIEIFGISFMRAKNPCKLVVIDNILTWVIADNINGMKLFDLFVKSDEMHDVSLHLKDCRFVSVRIKGFNVVKLINGKNPIRLLDNISKLYFVDDKFLNYSKTDLNRFSGDCKITDVNYINCYPSVAGGLVVNGLNMRLPINHNYLYRLLSDKLAITKREFDNFIDWCEDKIFTNLQQFKSLFADYFDCLDPRFITFDIVDRSLSKVKRLEVRVGISLIGLHSVLLNINILGNLKIIYCIIDCYINSSVVSDYVLHDGLEYCEIGALTNICGLKLNLPKLRLRIYVPGLGLDFSGIYRIRVLGLRIICGGICNKLELCKFPYERILECANLNVLSRKIIKILNDIESYDISESYWGGNHLFSKPDFYPSKNFVSLVKN
jgi:hypothetical protein